MRRKHYWWRYLLFVLLGILIGLGSVVGGVVGEVSFGVEYLSPDKNDSLGYRPVFANLDRGFIFGNLSENLETLT